MSKDSLYLNHHLHPLTFFLLFLPNQYSIHQIQKICHHRSNLISSSYSTLYQSFIHPVHNSLQLFFYSILNLKIFQILNIIISLRYIITIRFIQHLIKLNFNIDRISRLMHFINSHFIFPSFQFDIFKFNLII